MNPEKENKITYCITANCTIINSTDVLCSAGTRLSLAPCDLNWPGTSIASACAGAAAAAGAGAVAGAGACEGEGGSVSVGAGASASACTVTFVVHRLLWVCSQRAALYFDNC